MLYITAFAHRSAVWMFVYCVWCVLPGRGLCDELITLRE
jgi:hypothetical protein